MEPKPFEVYRHFKGNLYQIITLAEDTEAGNQLVIYQGLYPPFKVYARPLSMFMEKLDGTKYPDAAQECRFELVSDTKLQDEASNVLQNEAITPKEPAVATAISEISVPEVAVSTTASEESSVPSSAVSEETGNNNAGSQINQDLLSFLDAREAEEKLDILYRIHPRLTPEMLTAMELSQGMEPQETWSIEERYKHIQADIITKQKYEQRRL